MRVGKTDHSDVVAPTDPELSLASTFPQVADGSSGSIVPPEVINPHLHPPPGLFRLDSKVSVLTSDSSHKPSDPDQSAISSQVGIETPSPQGLDPDVNIVSEVPAMVGDLIAAMEALDNDSDLEENQGELRPSSFSQPASIFESPAGLGEPEEDIPLWLEKEEVVCAVHGVVCKRGVCTWWKENVRKLKYQPKHVRNDGEGFNQAGPRGRGHGRRRGRGGRGLWAGGWALLEE